MSRYLSAGLKSEFSLISNNNRWSAPALTYERGEHEYVTQLKFVPEKCFDAIGPSIVEQSADDSSIESTGKESREQSREWNPSYWRVGPLMGLAALLLAFFQIFASFAVLKLSDGHAISEWKHGWRFDPSVYIAVLTTLSNGAIQLAATQGAVVTFWLRLLRGTTLGQLHRDFEYGSEFYNALRSGKHISLVAVACIFATLVNMDGALLQRGSTTQSIIANGPVKLNVSVVPEVPSYFSGLNEPKTTNGDYSTAMLPIVNGYSSRTPITGAIQGCGGICSATIRAPALLPHHCESVVAWKNFSAPLARHQMQRSLYETYLTSTFGSIETLDFYTSLPGDEVSRTCAGPVNSTHCYLRGAIAEYEVMVTNGTITLTDPAYPKFVSWANNTAITNETIGQFNLLKLKHQDLYKTTFAGFITAFYYNFAFSATATPSKPGTLDIVPWQDPWFKAQHTTNYEAYNDNKACTYAFRDVRPAAMAGLNELMFRVGVHVAQAYDEASLKSLLDPGVETNYTVTGTLQKQVEIFKSDFTFYFAAAAVELLTILLVLSTFYGYWRLGRHVSFSPLEIAKAFGASLLARANSNSSGKEIASLLGDNKVFYVLTDSESDPVNLNQRTGVLLASDQRRLPSPESGSQCV